MGKVAFPGWAPVIGAQLVQIVQVLVEFAVLIVFLLALRNLSWTWLLAIPILIGTALFSMGIGLMTSILSARVGDTKAIVAIALSVLYFATPVLYPMSMAQGHSILTAVITLNPMAWYVQSMHDVMYSLTAPSPTLFVITLAGGAAVFILGFAVFTRASGGLAEVL
jgi:ABC-type polysaccharide/polyol phosphate export permease